MGFAASAVLPMITRDTAAFLDFARNCDNRFGPATARAAFMVAPESFARAEQSAADNRYMSEATAFDPDRALAQHRQLQRSLSAELPVFCFPGDADTPDAVFPNNIFATAPGRLVIGRMRHQVRQREADRADIRGFFTGLMDYVEIDLSQQPHVCELTGALVIDRARGLGFCGLSERCDEAGAALMHEAFGLRATLMFDLAPGEYHTNVVLAVLAGRAALIAPQGFAATAAAEGIANLYGPAAVVLQPAEHECFVANAIAVGPRAVWMSARAGSALSHRSKRTLADSGFEVRSVPLDAIEAGGGSLRCCVAEVF